MAFPLMTIIAAHLLIIIFSAFITGRKINSNGSEIVIHLTRNHTTRQLNNQLLYHKWPYFSLNYILKKCYADKL